MSGLHAFQNAYTIQSAMMSFDGIRAIHRSVDHVPEFASVNDGLMWLGVGLEVQCDLDVVVLLFKPVDVAGYDGRMYGHECVSLNGVWFDVRNWADVWLAACALDDLWLMSVRGSNR